MIHIKKYPNRKMYLPNEGSVILPDILKYVLDGKEFKITEFKSGNDVTLETLGAALLLTLQDFDCDSFDLMVTAVRNKKGWKRV